LLSILAGAIELKFGINDLFWINKDLAMCKIEKFGTVTRVSITILMDNQANLIVKSSESIKYFQEKPLLAEHGFSALIQFGDREPSILLDGGNSQSALMENIVRMKIAPSAINQIVLSHGHDDHHGGISKLLDAMVLQPKEKKWQPTTTIDMLRQWIENRQLPLITHPASFRERWRIADDDSKTGPFNAPPKREWEAKGANIILSEAPYRLTDGCWTSGNIPRETDTGFSQSKKISHKQGRLCYRENDQFLTDHLEDDQAVVVNVKNKGLVIVSGCAHAGIINTIHMAKKISGVDRLLAIIGGFHLAMDSDEELQSTIHHLKQEKPELVVPQNKSFAAFKENHTDVNVKILKRV